MQIILIIGCLTALWGAIAGLVQLDIKKALAYSTVSQLGFMFMACGVGRFDVALFHVFTHAFFKATLFLSAGSVIHGLHHEQDMRRMGGLVKLMPITYTWMWCGWYAIIGLPGGSGFFSKDLILEHLLHGPGFAPVIGGIAIGVALLTAIYMSRVMYLTFWSPARMSDEVKSHIHESPITMILPICILGFGSLVVGVLWSPLLEPRFGTHFFQDWLSPVVGDAQRFFEHVNNPQAHGEVAEMAEAGAGGAAVHPLTGPDYLTAILGTTAALVGLIIARILWIGGKVSGPADGDLQGFAAAWTWGFDRLYHVVVILPVQIGSWILSWIVNELWTWLQGMVATLAKFLGEGYIKVQRPRLRSSLTLSLAGTTGLIAVLLFTGPIAWVVGGGSLVVAVVLLSIESHT